MLSAEHQKDGTANKIITSLSVSKKTKNLSGAEYWLKTIFEQYLKIRDGKNDILSSNKDKLEVEWAQYFWARVELKIWVSSPDEPELVKISLEPASKPELFTYNNLKIQARANFELFRNSGSLSLEPGAYLMRAKNSAWAFELKPRLIPSLTTNMGSFILNKNRACLWWG